ncbi:proline-rich protein PRCC [Planococcus citri]|uniref:proline-rich protein PRCC n=1 Tax=Planococcus citri TaxID=170843 RepID=UPI0031F813E7
MALVAYDCSDESEPENDEDVPIIVEEVRKLNVKTPLDPSKIQLSDDEDEIVPSSSKFFLPAPTKSQPVIDEGRSEDVVATLKSMLPPPKSVKKFGLTLQPLRQKYFQVKTDDDSKPPVENGEDEDQSSQSKLPSMSSGTGLLAVLPRPLSEQKASSSENKTKPKASLIPQAFLKAKPMPTQVSKPSAQPSKPSTQPVKPANDDDDDDVDVDAVDFFSLNKNDFEDLPEPIDIDIALPAPTVPFQGPRVDGNGESSSGEYTVPKKPENFNMTYQDSAGNSLNLDEQTMQRHFGRKRKGDSIDDMEVIDVSQEDVLAESKRLVTMQLTEEGCTPMPYKLSGPSTLSKRKHQITYLAFQAKAREQELKNFWAQNRLTKKQTQQKYGF